MYHYVCVNNRPHVSLCVCRQPPTCIIMCVYTQTSSCLRKTCDNSFLHHRVTSTIRLTTNAVERDWFEAIEPYPLTTYISEELMHYLMGRRGHAISANSTMNGILKVGPSRVRSYIIPCLHKVHYHSSLLYRL
jgi:hypothetical protein